MNDCEYQANEFMTISGRLWVCKEFIALISSSLILSPSTSLILLTHFFYPSLLFSIIIEGLEIRSHIHLLWWDQGNRTPLICDHDFPGFKGFGVLDPSYFFFNFIVSSVWAWYLFWVLVLWNTSLDLKFHFYACSSFHLEPALGTQALHRTPTNPSPKGQCPYHSYWSWEIFICNEQTACWTVGIWAAATNKTMPFTWRVCVCNHRCKLR